MDEDRYLTPREAARHLGVSRQSLYDYIKRHALPCYQLPGSRGRRFKKADLDALLKRRQGERTAGYGSSFGSPALRAT